MTNTEKFKEVLKGIADNIRTARGTTDKIAFNDLVEMSAGLEVPPDTYILVDEDGNEVAAVAMDERVELTAKADTDIRVGTTAITNEGVVEGTKEIPAYYVAEGVRAIATGSDFVLPHVYYDYTKLQALFCAFNTSLANSVSTDKVAINDAVYPVTSTEALSAITKDHDIGRIIFGIANDTDSRYLIRYFMFKEIY